jgi:hypothetical protein
MFTNTSTFSWRILLNQKPYARCQDDLGSEAPFACVRAARACLASVPDYLVGKRISYLDARSNRVTNRRARRRDFFFEFHFSLLDFFSS